MDWQEPLEVARYSDRARGSGVFGADAVDWRAGWAGGGRIYFADRTVRCAAVSGGRRGVATGADSDGKLAGNGLPALPVFSKCARQWCAANKSSTVCP